MGQKQTKAQQILSEAQGRVQLAENILNEAYRALEGAQATLKAHRDAYDALEKSLAPVKRKAKDAPKSTAPSAGRRSSRRGAETPSTASTEAGKENALAASKTHDLCAICGNVEMFVDHEPEAPDYHVFRTSLKKKDSHPASGLTAHAGGTQTPGNGSLLEDQVVQG